MKIDSILRTDLTLSKMGDLSVNVLRRFRKNSRLAEFCNMKCGDRKRLILLLLLQHERDFALLMSLLLHSSTKIGFKLDSEYAISKLHK